MTQEPACPQCGTPVQPTWDWCHACGFDPGGHRAAAAAAAPPTAPAPAPSTPPVPVPAAAWSAAWSPPPAPAPTTPPRSPSSRVNLIIVGAVGLVAVLVVGVIALRHQPPPPLTADQLTPTTHAGPVWVHLTNTTLKFTIDFPGQWSLADPAAGDNAPEQVYEYVDTSPFSPGAYELGVLSTGASVGIGQEQAVLLQGSQKMASQGVATSSMGTFAGHNALSFTGKGDQGQDIVGVIFLDHDRLYLLGTSGRLPKESTDRFLASFHFL